MNSCSLTIIVNCALNLRACAGVMKVTCPSMPNSITISLPKAASTGSKSHQASTAALGNGPAAQDSHRLAKSLQASLQPTPVKALGQAGLGSSGPARSTDAQDSDVDSIAGSVVSQSGGHYLPSHGSWNGASWHCAGQLLLCALCLASQDIGLYSASS